MSSSKKRKITETITEVTSFKVGDVLYSTLQEAEHAAVKACVENFVNSYRSYDDFDWDGLCKEVGSDPTYAECFVLFFSHLRDTAREGSPSDILPYTPRPSKRKSKQGA